MQKCYNIMITGTLQDIGFMALIEDIARLYELKGFTFNDVDGSVKMVCGGGNGVIADFLEEINSRGTERGVVIHDITREEIPFQIYLPHGFSRLYTDDLADIGRKLDKGIEILGHISNDTSELPGISKGIEGLNSKFDSFSTKFDSSIIEQKEHNQWMKGHLLKMDEHNKRMEEHNQSIDKYNKRLDEHNQRLEKILLKLAD